METNYRLKEPNYRAISLYLALANAVITALVLVSPFGVGDGSGMIGYSIARMLVMVIIQAPIAIGGVIASIACWRHKLKWLSGLFLNIIVFTSALFLYFAQSRTIEPFL